MTKHRWAVRLVVGFMTVAAVGCSTRPYLDFLDWVRPGRVDIEPGTNPYGGVCIPQGELPGRPPAGTPAPIPAPAPIPGPEPIPPSAPLPPSNGGIPPPPSFPNPGGGN